MDLVPETRAWGMTLEIAFVSGPSPVGVAVAWALTCPTSSAVRPGLRKPVASPARRRGPPRRGGHVVCVGRATVAGDGGDRFGAPRSACSGLSRMRAPAPRSSRSRRGLVEGAARAVRVVVAPGDGPYRAEAGHAQGVIGASEEPAITTSASPRRISSSPSAIASAPVAQARTGHWLRPRGAEHDGSLPAAMFGTIIVIRNGLTLPGPRSFRTRYSRSQVESPPMPLPITIATRSGLSRTRSAIPRSRRPPVRRRCRAGRSGPSSCRLLVMKSVGSKSEHSPAICEGKATGRRA